MNCTIPITSGSIDIDLESLPILDADALAECTLQSYVTRQDLVPAFQEAGLPGVNDSTSIAPEMLKTYLKWAKQAPSVGPRGKNVIKKYAAWLETKGLFSFADAMRVPTAKTPSAGPTHSSAQQKIVLRDPNELTPHPLNSAIYDERVDEAFDAAIKAAIEDGTLEPVIVTSRGMIISGHRRVRAAIRGGTKAIPTITMNFENEALALILHNKYRDKTPGEKYEEGIVLQHEITTHRKLGKDVLPLKVGEADPHDRETGAIVAEQVGLSRESWRRLTKVLEAPEAPLKLKQELRRGDVTIGGAYQALQDILDAADDDDEPEAGDPSTGGDARNEEPAARPSATPPSGEPNGGSPATVPQKTAPTAEKPPTGTPPAEKPVPVKPEPSPADRIMEFTRAAEALMVDVVRPILADGKKVMRYETRLKMLRAFHAQNLKEIDKALESLAKTLAHGVPAIAGGDPKANAAGADDLGIEKLENTHV